MDANTLTTLANEYPVFRRFLVLRSTKRRSYFLKVLDDMKQWHELKNKQLADPRNTDLIFNLQQYE